MTLGLFDSARVLETIPMIDAEVQFINAFYSKSLSKEYRNILLAEILWRQETITISGRKHLQPRLTAWYGDPGCRYSYSGIALDPNAWTPTLRQIKQDIEAATGHCFNSVLLNLYRDERDSMGWHSDAEAELGSSPVIASLSLGETRTFKLKHKIKKEQKQISLELTDGSLLVMAGSTQKFWLHSVDKERKTKDARINLTFRNIVQKNMRVQIIGR